MQGHRTGFIKASALGEWQQGGCSGFFFSLGFRMKQGVKAWGGEDEEEGGLIVYGESGKKWGASQDAIRN